MRSRVVQAAFVVGLAITTVGCGDGGRPTQADVRDTLLSESTVDEKSADCLASALVQSDLSDEALKAIVEGDEGYQTNVRDEAALASVFAGALECAPELGDVLPAQ